MPWIVAICACLVGGCFFAADYTTGTVRCSDDKCPSGLTCRAGVCVDARIDAAVDAPVDVLVDTPDAQLAALTCSDPGLLPAAGGTAMGSTASRSSTISAMCGAFVMNGPDAVYRVDTTLGEQIMLTISGSFAVNAYVIASPCMVAPAVPTCIGTMMAAQGSPISVTPSIAGAQYIIVDATSPGSSGDYTLVVAVN